jgi:hypothetical protein
MSNNSHETTILALILLIVLVWGAWSLVPKVAQIFERATKVPVAQQIRL